MASPSSPTSSCSSSYSSSFSNAKFSYLPVMALREKIVEKILDNRVTLIVGETGCGTLPTLLLRTVLQFYYRELFRTSSCILFYAGRLVPEKTEKKNSAVFTKRRISDFCFLIVIRAVNLFCLV